MQIVPVLDLLDGVAVHAVAGERANYHAVESRLGRGSDPVGLARAMLASVGATSLYVADLGAITGGRRHEEWIAELLTHGSRDLTPRPPLRNGEGETLGNCLAATPLPGDSPRGHPLSVSERGPGGEVSWVSHLYWDAGLTTPADRDRLPTASNFVPIWASETADPLALAQSPPSGPAAFSVDLAGGVIQGDWHSWHLRDERDAAGLAAAGVRLTGATTVIILDLKGVGVRGGPIDGDLIAKIRDRLPAAVRLGVGGGVRHDGDLTRLDRIGVEFVLVATAIHDGTLTLCRRDTTDG